MSSSETLSVAISGCHRQVTKKIGAHNFATFFDAVPETRISAVFDLGPETKEEFVNCWGDVAAYDNYGQMLDESKPDIICIATSHKMHADQVEAAVASGVRGIIVVPRRFQWYIAEGMLSLPTAKWSMVISFFSGVLASGFAFGCAKDTVEFFNAGIGEVRFPVGEGFLLVIFDYVGPWV